MYVYWVWTEVDQMIGGRFATFCGPKNALRRASARLRIQPVCKLFATARTQNAKPYWLIVNVPVPEIEMVFWVSVCSTHHISSICHSAYALNKHTSTPVSSINVCTYTNEFWYVDVYVVCKSYVCQRNELAIDSNVCAFVASLNPRAWVFVWAIAF